MTRATAGMLSKRDARNLAALMLVQGWDARLMQAAAYALWPNVPGDLSVRVMAAWNQPYPPSEVALTRIVQDSAGWVRPLPEIPLITEPPMAQVLPVVRQWDLPTLASAGALADWLGITTAQLDWFADCQGRLARPDQEKLTHYTPSWIPKRTGRRLIEAPRPRLKAIQRKLLAEILDRVPAHKDAFGFVTGRSCLGHAARHADNDVVVTLDLANFFPSVPARRVHGIFRTLGYSAPVARLMTGLCTTRTPWDVLATLPAPDRALHRVPHLAQGAPTSPALANLAAYRLDVRLAGLARRMCAQYSRYADDIAFSGDRGLVFDHATPLLEQTEEIIRAEGFRPNPAKTHIMRSGRPQRVTGMVVNRHINISRTAYDQLKAILTNCLRHGPASQNRAGHRDFRAHLDGRVHWVEQVNPQRGSRLRAIFRQIRWEVRA